MVCAPSTVTIVALSLVVACGGSEAAAELGPGTAAPSTPTSASSGGLGGTSTSTSVAPVSSSSTTHSADSTGQPVICGGGEVGALTIGHGLGEFIPLADQPAELLHGPQGGVHITLGIRCIGLEVSRFGDVWLHGEIAGRIVADHPQGAVLTCDEDTGVAEGLWLSMVFEVGPEVVHGQRLDMEITVTDDVGTTVTAQAQTLVLDPELTGSSGSSGSGTGASSTGS